MLFNFAAIKNNNNEYTNPHISQHKYHSKRYVFL